jgi:hypothetical protein
MVTLDSVIGFGVRRECRRVLLVRLKVILLQDRVACLPAPYLMIELLYITSPYKSSNLTHFSDVYVILFNCVVSGEGYFGMNKAGHLCTLNRKKHFEKR